MAGSDERRSRGGGVPRWLLVVLTRDRRCGASAQSVLAACPRLAVVIVTLSRAREAAYLTEFEAAWERKPIEPVAGAIIEWP